MNNRRLLEIAEYISLISSVAGSFAAMAFGQVAYATTLLSLSILLSLVSRYRFEQQTQESTNAVITKTHQQLSADIQSLRSSVLNQPAQVNLGDVQQALLKLTEEIAAAQTKLESRLASLLALDPKQVNEAISRLTNQYTSLSESLNDVRQQLDSLSLSEKVDALQSAVFQCIAEIAVERTKTENHLSPYEALNIESIQTDISQIRKQCTALQEFLDGLVYRMLSHGGLSSQVCSDEIESRLSKTIQYYREQRDQKAQKHLKSAMSLERPDESMA